MVTQNVATKRRRAWTTSVFIKQLMVVSGFVLAFSLLFRSYGNLKMFPGAGVYNDYTHWLHEEAFISIFPHGEFIWVFRVTMVLMLAIYLWTVAYTWKRSHRACSTRYVVRKSVSDSYAARITRMNGVLILLILILHIVHFTTMNLLVKVANFGADATTPYARTVASSQSPILVILYAVFVGCVCIRVSHGLWSVFQSLGWVHNATRKPLVLLLGLVGLVIFVMFMTPPVTIATSLIH